MHYTTLNTNLKNITYKQCLSCFRPIAFLLCKSTISERESYVYLCEI